MSYQTLNDLWKHQDDTFARWRIELRRSAELLRTFVEKSLGLEPNAAWREPNAPIIHRYVEVIDLGQSKPMGVGIDQGAIDDDGAFRFGLAITFEQGPQTFPKCSLYVPVALRFRNSKVEFVCLEPGSFATRGAWKGNMELFADDLIEDVRKVLLDDPFVGASKKSVIGFTA